MVSLDVFSGYKTGAAANGPTFPAFLKLVCRHRKHSADGSTQSQWQKHGKFAQGMRAFCPRAGKSHMAQALWREHCGTPSRTIAAAGMRNRRAAIMLLKFA